ncbi:hypothetical protein RI129_007901 [Pyrocoelia pectoralis]|uniref:Glucose-methanol-choline oxidoreductase N-terminal domain-containing protein n=1 Tax=Pyrocoelia pectoralis TaxID=417401 RepID=A0AAN7VFB9_9COLE
MKIMYIIGIFSLSVKKVTPSDPEIVSYYANLINTEIKRAFIYSTPKDATEFVPISPYVADGDIYDYVIIGAGSAGSVIASRLTEPPHNYSVLLIEAGGTETNFTDIPVMNLYSFGLEFNWNYKTVPQNTSCLGMFDRRCTMPRGKGLGGSSIINSLMYIRGSAQDYDDWYLQGNLGWYYGNVLRLFKKSEHFTLKNGDAGYHGYQGYLNVDSVSANSPQVDAFIAANKELGRNEVDYNGRTSIGVSRTQTNTINGRRQSVYKAFLQPALSRHNLKISTKSFATRILLDKRFNRALGVTYSKDSWLYSARARKEVIVSSGTFGSPQLLMLSGIGPKDHLQNVGIPLVKDLAVGENLHDHPTYYALIFTTNYTAPTIKLEEEIQNYLSGRGAFTVGGQAYASAFLKTNPHDSSEKPDIELIIAPSGGNNDFMQRAFQYDDESYTSIWSRFNPTQSFTIFLTLLRPRSRGRVKLKSQSPYDYPLIDSNFLSDENNEDIETLYNGVQMTLELIKTSAFQKLNTTLFYSPLPACQVHEYLSKDYWYCQLRQLTMHIFHPVGTCKMGPDPYQGAVVDHELKVHGIKNLRVADASIAPTITTGHTNAMAIMIGEFLSELIVGN